MRHGEHRAHELSGGNIQRERGRVEFIGVFHLSGRILLRRCRQFTNQLSRWNIQFRYRRHQFLRLLHVSGGQLLCQRKHLAHQLRGGNIQLNPGSI